MIDHDAVSRARAAAEAIAPLASRIEAERRLPEEAVRALVAAGVFKLVVPRVYGGGQATPSTLLAVIETIAHADGSAGWCTMIGATSGLMSVHLDDALAREVFGPDDAITCGVFAPSGRAERTPGGAGAGYRVSGRWSFASGCQHSAHRMGGVLVAEPGAPPAMKSVLFRAEETRIVDTWDTSGLRGTGSHDLEVSDVEVPEERVFSLTGEPRHAGYALPFFGLLAAGVAGVGLGIARRAIETLIEVARSKKTPGGKRTQADRELVQLEVGRSEARLRSARAFLHEALADATEEGNRGGAVSPRARALLRLAASHAAGESAAVATTMYELGGGSSVYTRSPLQRLFRDAHVVTQHLMVGTTATTTAGRVVLGLETDLSTL